MTIRTGKGGRYRYYSCSMKVRQGPTACEGIRDQAKADADRAQAMLQNSGQRAVTPQMLRAFAKNARQSIRLEGGGYRRDHLRALAQRVEVNTGEVRIMGSKSRLLQALVPGGGVNAVPIQGLKWRRGRDSAPISFRPDFTGAFASVTTPLVLTRVQWELPRQYARADATAQLTPLVDPSLRAGAAAISAVHSPAPLTGEQVGNRGTSHIRRHDARPHARHASAASSASVSEPSVRNLASLPRSCTAAIVSRTPDRAFFILNGNTRTSPQ